MQFITTVIYHVNSSVLKEIIKYHAPYQKPRWLKWFRCHDMNTVERLRDSLFWYTIYQPIFIEWYLSACLLHFIYFLRFFYLLYIYNIYFFFLFTVNIYTAVCPLTRRTIQDPLRIYQQVLLESK